jgi:O-succinylbenzoate synthase
MRVDSLEIHRVAMPLVYPFRTATGDDHTIESVLVRMASGDRSGWGETAPGQLPTYSGEWAAAVFLTARDVLAPLLLGEDIASGEDLQQRLSHIKGNQFAKAVLDSAWWDLYARTRGEPLWQSLGGSGPTVDVGADFGIMETIESLLDTIGTAVESGFKRIKLKYRPGWELDMVAAVRAAYPNIVFHVDCNSAYRLDDLPMLKRLDEYGLAMIEQPLAHDDLLDHAELQRHITTPICLDESITSLDKTRKAIAIGATKWVNIKYGRVGGVTNARAIHDLCAQSGLPCWIGGMLESAVGASHCLALATLPNVKYPSDIFPSSRFYREDLAAPEIALSGPSQVTAQQGPGIGVHPRPEELSRLTLEHALLRA